MKTSKFTEAQILGILNQAAGGISVPELCRQHGMSDASFFKSRAKYGGMDVARPLKSDPPQHQKATPATQRLAPNAILN